MPWHQIFRKFLPSKQLGWEGYEKEADGLFKLANWPKTLRDKRVIKQWLQGTCIVLALLTGISVVLAVALAWGPHHCKPAFPMVIGCAVGSYESLAGGLIAAAAALIAGLLAWRAVQVQIDAEQRRANADRIEVEEVLQVDIDSFAEGLAAIWKILEGIQTMGEAGDVTRTKLEGVIYGIEFITKPTWLSTSRRMVSTLGWERRRRYEALFDGLEQLGRFKDIDKFDVESALITVKDISVDFELVRPQSGQYFEGLFRRSPKAWTLGYGIEVRAGVAEY
jgi:hypothetical protein